MGTEGTGKFFFDMWQNSIDSDELFEVDLTVTKEGETNNNLIYEKFKSDADQIINSPGRNGFAKILFHWSEDPRKDINWYDEQRRQQNFNKRKIAQEYDIKFTGSTNNKMDCLKIIKIYKFGGYQYTLHKRL